MIYCYSHGHPLSDEQAENLIIVDHGTYKRRYIVDNGEKVEVYALDNMKQRYLKFENTEIFLNKDECLQVARNGNEYTYKGRTVVSIRKNLKPQNAENIKKVYLILYKPNGKKQFRRFNGEKLSKHVVVIYENAQYYWVHDEQKEPVFDSKAYSLLQYQIKGTDYYLSKEDFNKISLHNNEYVIAINDKIIKLIKLVITQAKVKNFYKTYQELILLNELELKNFERPFYFANKEALTNEMNCKVLKAKNTYYYFNEDFPKETPIPVHTLSALESRTFKVMHTDYYWDHSSERDNIVLTRIKYQYFLSSENNRIELESVLIPPQDVTLLTFSEIISLPDFEHFSATKYYFATGLRLDENQNKWVEQATQIFSESNEPFTMEVQVFQKKELEFLYFSIKNDGDNYLKTNNKSKIMRHGNRYFITKEYKRTHEVLSIELVPKIVFPPPSPEKFLALGKIFEKFPLLVIKDAKNQVMEDLLYKLLESEPQENLISLNPAPNYSPNFFSPTRPDESLLRKRNDFDREDSDHEPKR